METKTCRGYKYTKPPPPTSPTSPFSPPTQNRPKRGGIQPPIHLLLLSLSLRGSAMVEKASAVARKLDVSVGRCSTSPYGSGGLPSPTSPLDRAALHAPSPRGVWRHRDAGGVGLGILAALEAQEEEEARKPAVSAVAIAASASASSSAAATTTRRRAARLEVSELGCSGRCATSLCGSGAGAAAFRVAEFLACCDLCRRPLDGKDIFMYRGERAFCSMECRYHAIVSDEFQQEKDRRRRDAAAAAPRDIPSKVSAAPSTAAAEIAGSPCSGGGQIFFTTGIVAA